MKANRCGGGDGGCVGAADEIKCLSHYACRPFAPLRAAGGRREERERESTYTYVQSPREYIRGSIEEENSSARATFWKRTFLEFVPSCLLVGLFKGNLMSSFVILVSGRGSRRRLVRARFDFSLLPSPPCRPYANLFIFNSDSHERALERKQSCRAKKRCNLVLNFIRRTSFASKSIKRRKEKKKKRRDAGAIPADFARLVEPSRNKNMQKVTSGKSINISSIVIGNKGITGSGELIMRDAR